MDGSFYGNNDKFDAENSKDNIISAKTGPEPDEEAAQHRKDEPAPDEEAYATDKEAPQHCNIKPAPDEEPYVTDKEAVQHRKIEPACDGDEPDAGNNRPMTDEEAYQHRNNRSVPGKYKCRRQDFKERRGDSGIWSSDLNKYADKGAILVSVSFSNKKQKMVKSCL